MRGQQIQDNPLADAFGQPEAPALVTRTLQKSAIAVTELRSDRRNFGPTKPIPYDDAYLISLQLRTSPDFDQFFDDRYVRPKNFEVGTTSFYDLRSHPTAEHRDPFRMLVSYVPRKALDGIADEAEAPRFGELDYQPGVGVDDPVIRQLLSSLLPALVKPAEASAVFVDHVALALCAHVAHAYGGMPIARHPPRGGLAPWQERRAKELLRANLVGEIPLDRLAAECGLSVRHFARAFRQSMGVPPHRWLLKQRVQRAKELLGNPALPLAEVAVSCGFADQSHFTRVFAAMTGVGPGAWRRMRS
jgi:AraC family transcriptional regulator